MVAPDRASALQEWMKANGFEVKTLAQRLNFNPWSIYKVLNGDREPSWELRGRFTAVFGTEAADEVFGELDIEHVAA